MRPGLPVALILALWLLSGVACAQSLLDFYRQALGTNPSVRTRAFGVEQSKAQEALAASKLLPQVVGTGNYNWNDFRQSGLDARRYTGVRADVQARQPLLDLAAYFKLQGAHRVVAQSEQQQEAARMVLGGEVVERYLTVLEAEDEIRNLRAERQEVESQLKRLRFMRERELVKVTDVYEVEAYYQGLLTRDIEARNARAVALERLRETTGLAAKRVAPLARENFPPVPGREEDWVRDAARNNPTLVALQHAIDAARELIESGRSEHLPKLSVTASRTYSDQGYDNRLVPRYMVDTVGVQLVIPLYEGGRVQATVREATARYEMAREQHERARREIEGDTRTAYLGAVANLARIGSTNQEVRALERVLDAQQKSYRLGVSTLLDVLIVRRRLFKARSDQSKARYDYIRDLTLLRVRAGSLGVQDVEEIDRWMAVGGRGRALPR